MRVAIVTPWYPSDLRPSEGVFVEREARALRDAGLDVRVVHLTKGLRNRETLHCEQGGVPVLRMGMNPANPASVATVAPLLRRATAFADIINTHAISALPVAIAARFDEPWVHTEHWSALSAPKSASALLRAVRPAFASMLRAPDVVVAESDRLAEPIRRYRGSRPIEMIPCIVPSPRRVRPLRAEALGSETRTHPDGIRLISIGGVIDRKNPLLAVRTVAELGARNVNARLRWVGDGPLISDATALAGELGVDAQFLGPRSPGEVELELAEADMFIGPTRGDNFYVAAAEALVNGRPIVVSDQGGQVEYAHPKYAQIVSEQSPEAYADAVLRLHEKMGEITAEEIAGTFEERFSPSTVANQYQQLYRQLLES